MDLMSPLGPEVLKQFTSGSTSWAVGIKSLFGPSWLLRRLLADPGHLLVLWGGLGGEHPSLLSRWRSGLWQTTDDVGGSTCSIGCVSVDSQSDWLGLGVQTPNPVFFSWHLRAYPREK